MTAALHGVGQFPHGRLRDGDAFATRDGGLRVVEACKKRRAQDLTVLPEKQGFRYRIFGALKPAGLDGLPDKGFLVRR
jgi:hypothetical protein